MGNTEDQEGEKKNSLPEGDNLLLITSDVLSIVSAQNFVTLPSTGATSIFTGTTRDNFEGKAVVRLEYEAYESMAYKEMEKLCTDMRRRWTVARIAIMHRIGEVPVSEISVIIAVSAEHRKPCIEAAHYAIDELKSRIPIWKKEVYSEGSDSAWKENKECFWT